MYETLTAAYYFDADDEEPDCGRCDNFDADDGVCKKCGPEYGWARYCRKELKEKCKSFDLCDYHYYRTLAYCDEYAD